MWWNSCAHERPGGQISIVRFRLEFQGNRMSKYNHVTGKCEVLASSEGLWRGAIVSFAKNVLALVWLRMLWLTKSFGKILYLFWTWILIHFLPDMLWNPRQGKGNWLPLHRGPRNSERWWLVQRWRWPRVPGPNSCQCLASWKNTTWKTQVDFFHWDSQPGGGGQPGPFHNVVLSSDGGKRTVLGRLLSQVWNGWEIHIDILDLIVNFMYCIYLLSRRGLPSLVDIPRFENPCRHLSSWTSMVKENMVTRCFFASNGYSMLFERLVLRT